MSRPAGIRFPRPRTGRRSPLVLLAAAPVLLAALVACGTSGRFPRPGGETAPLPGPASGLAAALDTLVPRVLERTGAPGAAVAAVEGGRIVIARGYGLADTEADVPLTTDTRIHVASISKSMTAWGVLALVESGAIGLDDPVDRHLARWSVPAGAFDPSEVTVRRLLNHTSGLGMAAVPGFPADEPAPSLAAVLSGAAGDGDGVTIERPPGAAWSYSGGGYTVLQLMVEDVTGEPFGAFIDRAVLDPIGMGDSSFEPAPADARGYDQAGDPVAVQRYVGTAAAGLTTTTGDVARWLREYHRAWSGRSVVLEASTLRAAVGSTAPVTLDGVEGARYGLGHGVHRRADGGVLLYHTGGDPGYRAWFLVNPAAGDGVFVAVNSDAGVPVIAAVRDVWGRLHGDDLPPLF